MIEVGEPAPTVTLPSARGGAYDDIGSFSLADEVGDGPIVLAFFPAAFTGGCTEELCTFRDSIGQFDAVDAAVYGISVDLPYALNVFSRQHDLSFPLLSDSNREAIAAYDVVIEDLRGVRDVAERAVFVVDADGDIAYAWERAGGENPDFGELVDDVREAAARAGG